MRNFTQTQRFNLPVELNEKLNKLKDFSIVKSRFVRDAIEEKFERDFPKLKAKKEKIYCPF